MVVWVGPGGPGGFGALLGVPLSFVTRTLSFSVILKSGIQLLPVFFVGTAYGMWGFILETKITSIKIKIPVVPFGVCFSKA